MKIRITAPKSLEGRKAQIKFSIKEPRRTNPKKVAIDDEDLEEKRIRRNA